MVRVTIRSTIGGHPPIVMDLDPAERIGDIKQRVARMRGLDPTSISFALRGKVLNDFSRVKDCGINDGDTIFMLLTNIVQGGWKRKDRAEVGEFEVVGGDKDKKNHGHAVYKKGKSLGSAKGFDGESVEIVEMEEKYVRTKNGEVVIDDRKGIDLRKR